MALHIKWNMVLLLITIVMRKVAFHSPSPSPSPSFPPEPKSTQSPRLASNVQPLLLPPRSLSCSPSSPASDGDSGGGGSDGGGAPDARPRPAKRRGPLVLEPGLLREPVGAVRGPALRRGLGSGLLEEDRGSRIDVRGSRVWDVSGHLCCLLGRPRGHGWIRFEILAVSR